MNKIINIGKKKIPTSLASLMREHPKINITSNQLKIHAYAQTLSTPQLERIINAHGQLNVKNIINLRGNRRLLEYLAQSAIWIKDERIAKSKKRNEKSK